MAAVKSGQLRHRVSLQKPERAQDPVTGELITTWSEVAKIWTKVEPLSVREFITAQATQSKISARITMRYRAGLDASMRIVHRGTVYNIAGVLPDADSGLEHITLPVSTGVNDGT